MNRENNRQSLLSALIVVVSFYVLDYLIAGFFMISDAGTWIILPVQAIKLLILIVAFTRSGFSLQDRDRPFLRGDMPVAVVVTGLLFILNALSSLLPSGGTGPAGLARPLFVLIISMSLAALNEELLFRGYLLQALERFGTTRRASVLISAALFSAGHIYLGVAGTVFSFSAALVLAGAYQISGGIRAGLLAHLVYNFGILAAHGYI